MNKLNDDGIYAMKMLNPGKEENFGLLFENFEKNANELVEKGYLIDMLPLKIQENIKKMEEFSDYDKKVCGIINTRKLEDKIRCPGCGEINGTYNKSSERIKFRETFVKIGYRKCWSCEKELFWFDKLAFGTRKSRMDTKYIMSERNKYLKALDEKKKQKERKITYMKDLAKRKRESSLKSRGMVGRPGDSWKGW